MKEPIRVYADTSVFGGVFEDEFRAPSAVFFEQVRIGRFVLVISTLTELEASVAPPRVRSLFDEVFPTAEKVGIPADAIRLRAGYLAAGILHEQHQADALHVAVATASGCSVITSWNFRHIVHLDKIPLYNAVNVLHGFSPIGIFSPREVIRYEEEV